MGGGGGGGSKPVHTPAGVGVFKQERINYCSVGPHNKKILRH
jgi:hypothetical protein